ncbi:MAG: GNAT family N-acetyltransferase [Campylobacterales bacterium]|nr:GNAT family N-acetyltransferase [Campylobacterales bacterium]
MTLRKALPGDVRGLYLLEQALFSAENFPLSKQSLYYHVRHNLLYLAQSETGEIAGYVLALVRRKDAKIYSLGVAQSFRGNKLAQKLMALVMKELDSLGFKRSLLEVRTDNPGAIYLYKSLGFSVTKRLEAFYRDGYDAYLMEAKNGGEKLPGTLGHL